MASEISIAKTSFPDLPQELLRLDFQGDASLLYPGTRSTGVVVIHGHGSHEDQPFVGLSWPSLIALRKKLLEKEIGLLSPNLFGNLWMAPKAADALCALLAFCREKFGWKKIILDAGSMGASSSLIFAMLHPEAVDAVCGSGQATDLARYARWCDGTPPGSPCHGIADAIRDAYGNSSRLLEEHSVCAHAEKLTMPLFLAHGAADAIIPVSESRSLVGTLATKPNLLYREIPAGDHDSPLACLGEHLELALQALHEIEPSPHSEIL